MRLGLAAIEGSEVVADNEVRRVRQLADLPGIGFESGLRSIQGLRGAGFTFPQSERLLREISNLVTLSGRGQEAVSRALYQLSQSRGLGEFRTEELRQLYEIAPQLRRVLQDLTGSSTGEGVQAAFEAQGLTFDQSIGRILDRLEKGVRAPETTLTNTLERLNDAFEDLLRGIGQDWLEAIKGLANATTGVLQWLTNNRQWLYAGLGGLATLGTAAGIRAIGSAFTGRAARRARAGGQRGRFVEAATGGIGLERLLNPQSPSRTVQAHVDRFRQEVTQPLNFRQRVAYFRGEAVPGTNIPATEFYNQQRAIRTEAPDPILNRQRLSELGARQAARATPRTGAGRTFQRVRGSALGRFAGGAGAGVQAAFEAQGLTFDQSIGRS